MLSVTAVLNNGNKEYGTKNNTTNKHVFEMDYRKRKYSHRSTLEDLDATRARELTDLYFDSVDYNEWSLLGFLLWFQVKRQIDDTYQQLLHSVFKNKCRDISSSSSYTVRVKNAARLLYEFKAVREDFSFE